MKRVVSVLCAVLLALTLLMPASLAAGSASAVIILSSSGVTLGDNVKVTIKYTASEGIGSWNIHLKYDKSMLQYVGGADGGGAGVLQFVGSRDSENVKTFTQTVTFKTLKVGSTAVSTNTIDIVSAAAISKMAVSDASAIIKIKEKPEDTTKATTKPSSGTGTSSGTTERVTSAAASNADLSSLQISPGTLSPAFSPSRTAYAVSVDYTTTSLVVSAQTANPHSVKTLSSTALQVGDNTIAVTVTAPSGKQKVYKITVTRGESPLKGFQITVGAVTYTPVYEGLKAPGKNFTATNVTYDNQTLKAYAARGGVYTLVCLLSPSGEKVWFMYDAPSAKFTKYKTVSTKAVTYVILEMESGAAVPAGYVLQNTSIDGEQIAAFVGDGGDTVIVNAMKPDGMKGLYYYDAKDGVFMKYTAGAVWATATPDDYDTMAKKLAAAEKNLSLSKVFMLVCAGLYAVLLVLGAVWIIRVKRSRTEE